MTDDEPQRLKASGETPEELVRALRALGRDRDGERLARVAGKLSVTLATSGAPTGSTLGKLLGNKLALTGLALGLGALGMLGYQLATRDVAPIERPASPAPVAAPVLAPLPAQLSPVAEPDSPSTDTDRAASEPQPRVKRAPRSALPPATQKPAVAQPSAEVQVAVDATETAEESSPPEPQDLKPAAQPPASEELLLYRARKAAANDPSEALRLLDEHAARFSAGLLVPEREVLAIEVLRSLGRDSEAAQRLQKFKARYPQSIHLRRLER